MCSYIFLLTCKISLFSPLVFLIRNQKQNKTKQCNSQKLPKEEQCFDWLLYYYKIALSPSHIQGPAQIMPLFYYIKIFYYSPGWCGSVDSALACKPRGHRFDSQSGHMPGLWARSPVEGAWGNHTLIFFSFSFSLPSLLNRQTNQ